MSAMDAYELAEPANVQDVGPDGSRYDLTFGSGVHRPKNETEEHALDSLVRHGHAKKIAAKASKPKAEDE